MIEATSSKSRRVLDTVVAALEEPILSGQLKVGEKLPSEEQLAQQLGVGRRAVREALKVLETKGLVEVQMGVGALVKRNDYDSFLDALGSNIHHYLNSGRARLEHAMELRLLLEGAALERLAEQPDEARWQRLAEAVDRQREAQAANDFPAYQEWYFRFHDELGAALENPILSMLYRQVMALTRESMEQAGALPERAARAIQTHAPLRAAARSGLASLRHVLQARLAELTLAGQAAQTEENARPSVSMGQN